LDTGRSILQYGHDRWNPQSGLPGSAVRGVFQLADGYLWLHSGGNLFRFDGVRFVQIRPEVDGHPTGEAVRVVSLGPNGKLLVRSMTRTLHLENGRFTEAMPPVQLPDGVDMAICEARDGTIWIASDNQIYRARQGRLERVVNGSGWTRDMMEDREGSVWVASISALHRFRKERLTRFPRATSGRSKGPSCRRSHPLRPRPR
jgi:ligand-binding sensor domain-containing protein